MRATYSIACICSGNRFRSPLASALVELLTAGYPFEIGSFGTLELGLQPPLTEAREIGLAYGVDLSHHCTRSLIADSLSEVDLVLGFEQEHVHHAVVDAGAWPRSSFTLPEVVSLLEAVSAPDDVDVAARARSAISQAAAIRDAQERVRVPDSIPDPLGRGWKVYTETAMRIRDLCVELGRGLVGDAQTQELRRIRLRSKSDARFGGVLNVPVRRLVNALFGPRAAKKLHAISCVPSCGQVWKSASGCPRFPFAFSRNLCVIAVDSARTCCVRCELYSHQRPRIRRLLTLTQEHVNRAFRIASWYGRRVRRAEISDLESAALEGLAKAARDWNPHRQRRSRDELKRSFWSFACTRILGEMRDELRRFDHLTRTQRAKVVEDERGAKSLADEGLEWVVPHEPVSLDATFAEPDDPTDRGSLARAIPESRDPIAELELRDAVLRAGACLPERVRLILVRRDLEGYSNDELARELELSRGRVSQLRNAGFEKMRGHIGDSLRDVA